MKIGFVSDAHGNPFGLRACLAELRKRGVGRLFFLGDAVGYFPLAEEVLEILRTEKIPCLAGNHEAMLCGKQTLPLNNDRIYGIGKLRRRLPVKTKAMISRWPARRRLTIDGCRIVMLHGGPRDPVNQYVYPDSDFSSFDAMKADAVFMGHTHIPFCTQRGACLLVNVGSCGLPRDIGSKAACAIFDTRQGTAEILRIPFNVKALLSEARKHGPVPTAIVRCLRRRRVKRILRDPT